MKKLTALMLLAITAGAVWYWRLPANEQHAYRPLSSVPATVKPHAVAQVQPLPAAQTAPADTLHRLPPSFKGTQVDGRLRADAMGRLIIEPDIRRVFDYFLASIGEEPIETSVNRLRRYIEAQLPQPARGQAYHLLGQYLDYKRQLLALEQDHPQQADIGAMRERLQAVKQLRATLFDEQVNSVFFAFEEAADQFTLERLAIRLDPALDAAAKGAALDRLHNELPPELQATLAPQLQSELRQQTRALQAKGGTPAEVRQLRQQLVGSAATARLEKLDEQRQQWRSRLAGYQQEKERIENSRGLSETDKRAAIERLAADRFDEHERQRLPAAEALLARKSE
ncbi:lipase secretion chaperone [Stutzerimonas stutzeri]|uniref:lipase secretion chaperone n=1 Tax=Stutzerimonas stutzeri TaxID=316 RepID=UPI001C2E68E8|nr:lipase secretion chaperone [Stutzerimonas stutzeri]